MIQKQCCLLDNLTNVIKNHVPQMFGTSHVKAQALKWPTSVEDEISPHLFLSDGLSSFHSFAYLFSTVMDLYPDRDVEIFSSSRGPSGRVLGPCGSHWKWGRQLIRQRCAAGSLRRMFGSQHSSFPRLQAPLTFPCPTSFEDGTHTRCFLLPSHSVSLVAWSND